VVGFDAQIDKGNESDTKWESLSMNHDEVAELVELYLNPTMGLGWVFDVSSANGLYSLETEYIEDPNPEYGGSLKVYIKSNQIDGTAPLKAYYTSVWNRDDIKNG